MKKILFTLSFAGTLLSLHAREGKIGPDYYIKKNSVSATLQKNEAHVLFSFYDVHEGKKVNGTVKYSYNGKNATLNAEGTTAPSLRLKPGKYVFVFFYSSSYYEVRTDSILIADRHEMEIQVNLLSSVYPVICDKPVIYVYPEKQREISINLKTNGPLSFTYPAYKEGWQFTADTSGKLTMKGKSYDYLFWEGENNFNVNEDVTNNGFAVSKDSVVEFLETKLTLMGLNDREREDFITYWAPQMIKHEAVFIHFLFNEEFGRYAQLNIDPAPKNLFRVFMLWSECEVNRKSAAPQVIPSFTRKGYTVVEWGGGKMNPHMIQKL